MKQRSTNLYSRRHFLKQTFVFSAAAALARGATFRAAAEPVGQGDHLFAVGDFGSNDSKQLAVATGMTRYVEDMKVKSEGLLLLGDNFYRKMEGGVTSARWRTGFEQMYPPSHFPGPCWAVLGNHDYHDNEGGEKTQLAYAAATPGTRWTMPAKWYRVDFPETNPLITFLCLDSNLPAISGTRSKLTGRHRASLTATEQADQLAWLKGELAKPRAAYTAVVAHHPLYTNGKHGDDKHMIAYLDSLLRQYRVQFYFCGHDHDLQHLEFDGHPTSFVVSGAGGARLYDLDKNERGPFAQKVYGFNHLHMSPEQVMVRFLDANRKLLHTFTKTPEGKVEVL